MATAATILEDIDDKFCQCCLCFEQYKDPRQLPCFHRYCGRCLDKEIDRNNGDLKCPLCQQEADVPEDGAHGLKKDFFMNEIIEFLDLKRSFQDGETHECGDCSQIVKARSYCFKCSEFLCDGCHQYHMTKKSLKEHRPYLLTLEDVKSKNLTLQKLSSLKQAPMCKTHPDDVSRLCCKTCGNIPICTACTYGDHQSHKVEDAISLARGKKEELRSQLAILKESRNRMERLAEQRSKLVVHVAEEADKKIAEINHSADDVLGKLGNDLKIVRGRQSVASKKMMDKWKLDRQHRHDALEEKIESMRKEHARLENEYKNDLEASIRKSNETYGKEESKLVDNQTSVQKQTQDGKALIMNEKGNKVDQAKAAFDTAKMAIERMQNLIETGSNILVSENNWTVIQNADRVCVASEPLIRELGGEIPEVDKVLEYSQVRLSLGRAEAMKIADKPVIEVTIEDIGRKGWYIQGVAAAPDGTVVITGGTSQKQAHISVIRLDGRISKQKLIASNMSGTHCTCAYFRDDEFAITTFFNANIGLYNTDNNSYHSTDLSKVINKEVKVWCVTADGSNDQIIVGCEYDPVLYVLNGKLQLTRTINLQQIIKSPGDIVVNNGTIFICCQSRTSVYAVNMEGGLLHELPKPGSTNCTIPYSVCTSNNGSVYLLWVERDISVVQDCAITQYNPDDGSLLTTTPIRAEQGWIAAAEIDGAEKLILPSWVGGMLRVYGLEEDQ